MKTTQEKSCDKSFDAVEQARSAKRRIAALLEDATHEQVLAYFNEGTLPERKRSAPSCSQKKSLPR